MRRRRVCKGSWDDLRGGQAEGVRAHGGGIPVCRADSLEELKAVNIEY